MMSQVSSRCRPKKKRRTKPSGPAANSSPAEPNNPTATVKTLLPVPPRLLALAPQLGIGEQTSSVFTQTHQQPVLISDPVIKEEYVSDAHQQLVSTSDPVIKEEYVSEDESSQNVEPVEAQQITVLEALLFPTPPVSQSAASVPASDQDVARWNCSQQQAEWMKSELEVLGLWPGSRPVSHPMNMVSLWRYPPQPELMGSVSELPSPKYFQLHPFFIWKPEHSIMERVRNGYILPCLSGCPMPQVAPSGTGRPRVIIGTSGQYYLLASRLTCKVCKKYWHADKPQWLEKLPERFTNMVPAFLSNKKAICKSVMDKLRRGGKSPEEMSEQLTEALHLKYERAHLAYLLSVQNVRDAEAGAYGQRTTTGLLRQADTPGAFGGYSDADGWCGASLSVHLVDCLLREDQLWHSLTTGSHTVNVPAKTPSPAIIHPPPVAPPQEESLSRAAVEKIVMEILEKQQQQPQKHKLTRTCLACGQPKSRHFGDGSSVHYFYQSNEVKYFYCSVKVFKIYAVEGLTDSRMPFEAFAASPFFERELEAARQRGAQGKKAAEERAKRNAAVLPPKGRRCRFCHHPVKQGPHSPHIHLSFPRVPGKYIYCPAKVFSRYKPQGMVSEMSWKNFQKSAFYKAERDRWVQEKGK